MDSDKLKKHIFKTYFNLRIGLGVLSILFPLILITVGFINGIKIQDSMSAYYHVSDITRNLFVGILCTVGIFHYLYRGFTNLENLILNIAGVFAICVALIPMSWVNGVTSQKFSVHGFCAVSLFICLAIVCIFCASATLKLLNDENKEKKFKLFYRIIGGFMFFAPLISWVLTIMFNHAFTLIAEIVCIIIFASYWLVKSYELSLSNAELKIFSGKFKV